ncbi:MAG TPA: urease accessory protein UreE [Polyangiaceae bacterium]|jgi:urease accessory protein|nr:urease accessory protein UreE [Polyangiaceae bacterium]
MLVARERAERVESRVEDTLSLPYDRRLHSRQRACMDGGEHIAVMLPRGSVLRDGDVLRCEGGRLVRVRAAPECVSRITVKNAVLLARAAYHLGNRHVPTQLGNGFVAYLHDHVLDDMITRLGFTVAVVNAPFEPEPGAYGQSGEHSHHGHTHSHGPHAPQVKSEHDSAIPPA